jgi:5-methylcytosine-specific restriction protein A
VDIEFDVLSQDPVLDESEFKTGILSKYHWYPEASGQIIPEEIAAELERMWAEKVGLNFIPSESRRQFIEGRKTRAEVTRIERNPDARRECIKQHGLACTVCNFEFVKEYGRVGRDFIIVHHLDPTSLRSGKHKVDPVKDLRPVCPNCHAMIHQRTPPFSIAEIKDMLKS